MNAADCTPDPLALARACALASALQRGVAPGPKPFEPSPLAAPAPCDQCWHAKRCGSEHLACEAFALFMRGARPSSWLLRKRTPDARLYRALLGDEGNHRPFTVPSNC